MSFLRKKSVAVLHAGRRVHNLVCRLQGSIFPGRHAGLPAKTDTKI